MIIFHASAEPKWHPAGSIKDVKSLTSLISWTNVLDLTFELFSIRFIFISGLSKKLSFCI